MAALLKLNEMRSVIKNGGFLISGCILVKENENEKTLRERWPRKF
jgi:hypothetical protein